MWGERAISRRIEAMRDTGPCDTPPEAGNSPIYGLVCLLGNISNSKRIKSCPGRDSYIKSRLAWTIYRLVPDIPVVYTVWIVVYQYPPRCPVKFLYSCRKDCRLVSSRLLRFPNLIKNFVLKHHILPFDKITTATMEFLTCRTATMAAQFLHPLNCS